MKADPIAERSDVIACYRQFLGREPENDQVVDEALGDEPGLWALIERFQNSPEALRRQEMLSADRVKQNQNSRGIETFADPAAFAKLVEHVRTVWSRYGDEDAYYSVLTHPNFHLDRITDREIESFYETGFAAVAEVEALFTRNGLVLPAGGTVFELGCGLARLAEAFRRHCARYVGIDISAGHLALARERLKIRGVEGITLMLLHDFILHPVAFDVLYSVIVLQHNPPPIIANLLDIALRRLKPGGLAYFQVPCFLYDYKFSVESYLRGEGRKEEMEIHAVPQHVIFDLLHKHGLVPVEVTPDSQIGAIGFSYCFVAQKSEHGHGGAGDLVGAAKSLSPWIAYASAPL